VKSPSTYMEGIFYLAKALEVYMILILADYIEIPAMVRMLHIITYVYNQE
jgi:hypothetical protein